MPSWKHGVQRLTQCKCSSSAFHTTTMNRLTCASVASVILLYEILNIRGEDWYSATKPEILENDNFTNNRQFLLSKLSQRTGMHGNGESLKTIQKPLQQNPMSQRRNISDFFQITDQQRNKIKWLQPTDYSQMRNVSMKPVEVIKYDNTINFVNIVKKLKPKRKIMKRRCPNQRIRQNKKIFSNQTAKTKFLEVFEVVQFENVACTSSSGLEGTCLHEYECEASAGSPMGTCADGYGTCCVTQFLCDGQSSERTGWFSNPGFPSPSTDRISCTFTLDKASADISQIRLDFATFELLGPNGGTCQQDQFIISGQNINSIIPIICGINTGQHVYVEVGETEGPIYLSVQTITTENRLYSIKVTQLTSNDDLTAPKGCLQYYPEEQGILESFNYRSSSEIGIPRVPSYLNNLNYAICILRAKDTCSVTYTNADYMQIVNYDLDGLPVIPHEQAGVEIFNCPGDWLLISATRLCGERLNDGAVLQDFSVDAPITDNNAGPIAVWFRTDEGYTGRGFKLQYQQNACNGP